jgi:molybdopterin-guanine dinucleotide biosynthesis protein B
MTELRGEPEPGLAFLLSRLSPVDLVVVEGFKRDRHPKIEVHRAANGKPWLHPDDPAIRAVAADVPPPSGGELPFASLDDTDGVAELVLRHAADVGTLWKG